MRINLVVTTSLLACALIWAPSGVLAQPQVGATELARVRALLDTSRADFSAEQFSLLSSRLVAAESAYAELTTVARAGQGAAAITSGGASASAEAVATRGRTLLGGAAELLPLLLLIWPATAHAPGVTQDTPEVRAARRTVEEKLKELNQAARQVETERAAAAARRPSPSLEKCLQACDGDREAPRCVLSNASREDA